MNLLDIKAFGERHATVRQTGEIRTRYALMNRLNALGTAAIVRAA